MNEGELTRLPKSQMERDAIVTGTEINLINSSDKKCEDCRRMQMHQEVDRLFNPYMPVEKPECGKCIADRVIQIFKKAGEQQ